MVVRRSAGLVGGLVLAVAVIGLLAAFAGLTLLQRWRSDDDNALRRTSLPPLALSEEAAAGPLRIVGPQPLASMLLTVAVTAPNGAQAVRVGQDPSFVVEPWQPVRFDGETEIEMTAAGTGYQTIFAQFLMEDGSVSATSVAGATIDPHYAAATASASADGTHRPSWVRPFSPTELLLRVEAGRLIRGSIEAYDFDDPPDGDDISTDRGRLVVKRYDRVYGLQVSKRRDAIRRPDRLIGAALDIDAVLDGRWTISSGDDDSYRDGREPLSIRHLARPGGAGIDEDLDRVSEVTYDIIVTMPTPLEPGATYRIEPAGTVAPATLDYDPATITSPAVRVNQHGMAPGDEIKLAYLSGWYDGIGVSATELNGNPDFLVIDIDTGDVAKRGQGRPIDAEDEMGRGDLTGAPVIALDFSSLDRPGRYRVCVDRIGCSYRFEISDRAWHELSTVVARALYHQRSGIELGPPFTPIQRPRPYHPADGATVAASDYSLLQAQTETTNTDFAKLVEQATDEPLAEAWGGHFDAGDWDRRINHLWLARVASQLVGAFPNTFEALELNIPESGDPVPDVLDEALWSIDLYRRMQLPNGAIRGGIEASEHPPANASSWADDLAVFAYAPDPFSTYLYAGVAAETSVALEPYDPTRADELLASSLAAMNWAEAADVAPGTEETVAEQRNVAAAALLLATGDPDWHDLFVRTATFLNDDDPYLSCHTHRRCDAAWLYLQADESLTDETIRAELRDRFIISADAIVSAADSTAYGWTTENPFVPLVWGLGSGGAPHTSGLLRAYLLTNDGRYRAAALRSAGAALGANPMNRALLTGIGSEPVRNPQINDVKYGGLPAWAGTPVYGHHLLNSLDDDQWVFDDLLGPAGADPDPGELPYLWQWYDVDSVALFNEFTVHQSHSEALWTFGILAATSEGAQR